MIRYCFECNKKFTANLDRVRKRKAKYCSYKCARKHQICSKETRKKMSKKMQGSSHHNWKGGEIKHSGGYIQVHSPNHPLRCCRNYVLKHRLVVEIQIGRYLKSSESVHHVNEIKNDNHPKNLICFSSESYHQIFHSNPNNVPISAIIFDGRIFNH